MPETELHDAMRAAGARFAEYRGSETASVFTGPRAEFAALASGCGVYDLGWRAKIIATGAHRVRWFNGMVTNNVKDLPPGHGAYNFLLNPQGHILADLYVYNRGDHLLVDTDHSQVEKLMATLERYIIMDDVRLARADEQWTSLGLLGPRCGEILEKAGLDAGDLEPLQLKNTEWRQADIFLVRQLCPRPPGYEFWVAPASAAGLWQALVEAGATPVGSEALEVWRIASGVPRYALDIRERDLPQETEQQHALHFTKGCYIGQEIVERIRSRGSVHRKFTGFAIEGALPAPGAKVQAGGKDVGEVTSAAVIPGTRNGDRTVALGYIRREAAAPGTEVQIGDTKARVASLPFASG